MNNRKTAIKKRMNELDIEMDLMDEAYKGFFPEPSEQLNDFNLLSDEYWQLWRELEERTRFSSQHGID